MKQNTEKKLKICIAVSVMLCVALCITSFALAILASSYVKENTFTTGTVDVSVSEKNSIYVASGFAPGMSLDRTYVVQNNSPVDVWYKVCFGNMSGDLQDVIEIDVREKSKDGPMIYKGTAKDFTEYKDGTEYNGRTDAIPAGGSREVWVTFTFPELSGNEYQKAELNFDFLVKAVQTKNNPDRHFE